jgi:hypothetical protein
MVDPVELHRRFSDHKSQVVLRIYLTETVMRPSSEDKEILRSLGLSVAGKISFGIIVIGVGVNFWIAESGINGGNDHGAWKWLEADYN